MPLVKVSKKSENGNLKMAIKALFLLVNIEKKNYSKK